MGRILFRSALVALSLMGSAILLFSCDAESEAETESDEVMMTEYSEALSVVMSQNGRRSYHFVAPLVEGYTAGREPYREFRKGVKITTYKDDSLTTVNTTLTANYAIKYEKRELWEAKGNVVVTRADGRTLYTQQLFWNARTKRIYTNVDAKIVREGSREELFGEGFESDEEFSDWRFRKNKVRMEVEMRPNADSTAVDSLAEQPAIAPKPRPVTPRAPSSSEPMRPRPVPKRRLQPSPIQSQHEPVKELSSEPIEK